MHPDIFSQYASRFDRTREEEYTIQEYLELCKRDPGAYASASERMPRNGNTGMRVRAFWRVVCRMFFLLISGFP